MGQTCSDFTLIVLKRQCHEEIISIFKKIKVFSLKLIFSVCKVRQEPKLVINYRKEGKIWRKVWNFLKKGFYTWNTKRKWRKSREPYFVHRVILIANFFSSFWNLQVKVCSPVILVLINWWNTKQVLSFQKVDHTYRYFPVSSLQDIQKSTSSGQEWQIFFIIFFFNKISV